MKKILIGILAAIVAVAVIGALAIHFFLDSAIKRGVEKVGTQVAKVEVKLNSASLSLISGSGRLKGLFVGNPEGFKTPSAINLGSASLALKPGSVFSDKVIIREINLEAPEITFESDLRGSNLNKILSNVEAATGGSDKQQANAPAQASKKLQVDDFLITGGKVHVSLTALNGQTVTVPLPEIHLQGLGQGPEGITTAELTRQVLQVVVRKAAEASASSVADLTKNLGNAARDLAKDPAGNASKITKGLGNLLKK